MTEMAMESKFVTLYKNQEKRAKRVHLKPSVQSNPPKWDVRGVFLLFVSFSHQQFRHSTSARGVRLEWQGLQLSEASE